MKKVILTILITGIFGTPAFAGDGSGDHGADGFVLGHGKAVTMEQLEYQKPFNPMTEPAFVKIVLPQLERAANILPGTVAEMLTQLRENLTSWFFIDYKQGVDTNIELKDVKDEGSSNILVTYKKKKGKLVQIAINDHGTIQIDHEYYEMLDLPGKAFVLLHEMFWNALLLNQVYQRPHSLPRLTGTIVRNLGATLLHPLIDTQSPENLWTKLEKAGQCSFTERKGGDVAPPSVFWRKTVLCDGLMADSNVFPAPSGMTRFGNRVVPNDWLAILGTKIESQSLTKTPFESEESFEKRLRESAHEDCKKYIENRISGPAILTRDRYFDSFEMQINCVEVRSKAMATFEVVVLGLFDDILLRKVDEEFLRYW